MARNAGVDRLAVARSLLDLHASDGYGVATELPRIAAGLVTVDRLEAFEALFRKKGAERLIAELTRRAPGTR